MSQPDTDKAAAAQERSRETEPLVISTNAGTIEPPSPGQPNYRWGHAMALHSVLSNRVRKV